MNFDVESNQILKLLVSWFSTRFFMRTERLLVYSYFHIIHPRFFLLVSYSVIWKVLFVFFASDLYTILLIIKQ